MHKLCTCIKKKVSCPFFVYLCLVLDLCQVGMNEEAAYLMKLETCDEAGI